MQLWTALAGCALAALASTSAAQHHGHHAAHGHAHAHAAAPHASPYSGMHQRAIKALSEEQIAGLQAGKGMGLAMPAELNGYPGPLHTLELAEQLQLSEPQKARTQQLFDQMKAQAQAAGHSVIEAERTLDDLFRTQQATPERLTAAVQQAAAAQGQLRAIHLRYHLAMMEVLSPEQVAAYQKLRGY